jgi:hypothetical protein
VGAANAALVLLGTSFLADSAHFFFFLASRRADPGVPYFRFAFVAMTLINVIFLVSLLVTAIRFIQLRISSINPYSLTVLVLFVYDYANGVCWRIGRGIGMSIGGARAVGNRGSHPLSFASWCSICIQLRQSFCCRYSNAVIPPSTPSSVHGDSHKLPPSHAEQESANLLAGATLTFGSLLFVKCRRCTCNFSVALCEKAQPRIMPDLF